MDLHPSPGAGAQNTASNVTHVNPNDLLFRSSSSRLPPMEGPNQDNASESDANATGAQDRDPRLDAGQGPVRWKKRRREPSRGKKACMPCRIRKCKCGGQPPDPCPICVEDEIACSWPAQDGRSSEARKRRSNLKVVEESGAQQPDPNPWMMDSDWLDSLTTGTHGSTVAGPSNYLQPDVPQSQVLTKGLNDPNLQPIDIPTFSPGVQFDQSFFDGDGSNCDPLSLIFAMSSRLPTVENGSLGDETSPTSDPSVGLGDSISALSAGPSLRKKSGIGDAKKTVKVTWWRPHGQTAIAPGLKRITLKVRIENASPSSTVSFARSVGETSEAVISPGGIPNVSIMRHLLGVFMDHFGCQFPALDQHTLDGELLAGSGSVFLFHCIAAVSCRFSTHPSIALPSLRPDEYGDVFNKLAKGLVGSMLSVPSRETVVALVLLAHVGFGADSESEEWMMTGMAVRMAIDLGLHLDPGEDSSMSPNDRRSNRLVFWSVALLDFALSFGTGRPTTFRIEDITQLLPSQEDIWPDGAPAGMPRSPFPFAAKQMMAYGPLITLLNGSHINNPEWRTQAQTAWSKAVEDYHTLPPDMQWNVTNLQIQTRAKQGPVFLHLHLWMHTIIASGYLTGFDELHRQPSFGTEPGFRSGTATPNVASSLWRHSATSVGEILVLSNVIDPFAYLALPFVNQAFFVAGCCYVKEIERYDGERDETGAAAHRDPPLEEKSSKPGDLSRALLRSVARSNISTLQQGLANQATYWAGVGWVAGTVEQRLSGTKATAIDLETVTEKLASSVSIADPGLLHKSDRHRGIQGETQDAALTSTVFDVDLANFDFSSMSVLNQSEGVPS